MEQRDFTVLVVGAGASGLGAAIRLGQAGVTDLAILE
jgi:cation diffusion facilitator CzcD-associated flavoprotein CzcO